MPILPLQGGLGEASCLALTSYYSGRQVITAWSSGTGFAGVFGYTWVAALHVLGGWAGGWVGGRVVGERSAQGLCPAVLCSF